MATYSVTDRRSWKTCRAAWDVTSLSRQGLEHPLPSKPLILGSLVHFTLAEWIKAPQADPVELFEGFGERAAAEIKHRYAAKNGVEMDEVEFEVSYGTPVLELGRAMIANYQTYYLRPVPAGYGVVGVEQTVTIEVPGTEYCCCTGEGCTCFPCSTLIPELGGTCHNICGQWMRARNEACMCMVTAERHKLEATFDALLVDPKGRIFVIDHKTYERRPGQNELAMDDQFLAYTWMANQLGLGPVVGVIYNGLWKRDWADLLDKKGSPRKKTDGSLYEFGDLFFRTYVPHEQREVEDFGRRLVVELNEMGNNPAIYLNRAWYSCPNCAVREMCMAKTRGEDWAYLFEEFVPRVKAPAWREEP